MLRERISLRVTRTRWSLGARAQHLALYMVFDEPPAMVSGAPWTYANKPGFRFIKDVPTTWAAIRVLNGEPG
jgi:alpha-glucosidase